MRIFLKNCKGTAAVTTALMMTLILGFCALVVDIGIVSIHRSRLQNAVDSAALAAAQDLPSTSDAAGTARTYLDSNGFSDAEIDVSFALNNRKVTVKRRRHAITYWLASSAWTPSKSAPRQQRKGGAYTRAHSNMPYFQGHERNSSSTQTAGTHTSRKRPFNNGFRYNGKHDSLVITGVLDTVEGSRSTAARGYQGSVHSALYRHAGLFQEIRKLAR